MGSDHAVAPLARLAAALDLAGLPVAAAEAATDKRRQRALFAEHGVPSAGFAAVETEADALAAYRELGPRIVIKPTDGAAQRGVSDVRSENEVAAAVAHAQAHSRSGRLIAEQYLDGPEYTVNAFVADGRFHPVTTTLRALAPPPAVGICTAHRYPSGRSEADVAAIEDATRLAAAAIGIDDAPVYAQLRFTADGPRLIECGARLGGGGDAALAALVTGIDLIDVVLDAATGGLDEASLTRRAMPEPFGQNAFVIPPRPGRVVRADVGGAAGLPGVHAVGFYHRAGGTVPPLWSASGRLGHLMVTATSAAELDRRTDDAIAALDIEVEPLDDDAAAEAWAAQVARAREGQPA
jgi:biotin carboxylase